MACIGHMNFRTRDDTNCNTIRKLYAAEQNVYMYTLIQSIGCLYCDSGSSNFEHGHDCILHDIDVVVNQHLLICATALAHHTNER